MTDARTLADEILKAAGSALKHYEPYSQDRIVAVAQEHINEERKNAVEDVLDMLLCHELYQYRPKAFKGFVEYARTMLVHERPAHRVHAQSDTSG